MLQCRDRGQAFGEASTSGRVAALKEWAPPPSRRKEDVALPVEAGWQWTDDWQASSLHSSFRLHTLVEVSYIGNDNFCQGHKATRSARHK